MLVQVPRCPEMPEAWIADFESSSIVNSAPCINAEKIKITFVVLILRIAIVM